MVVFSLLNFFFPRTKTNTMSAIIPTPFRPFLDNEIKLVDQLVTLNKPCTPSDWERIAEEYNYLLNSTANHGVKRDVQTLQTVWKCLPHDGRFKG